MNTFVIDLLTAIVITVLALPNVALLFAVWRRRRWRGQMSGFTKYARPLIIRPGANFADAEAFFEGQPDMSAGIFSIPTLDDAAGVAAVARDQAELHHERERAVELNRRQRRAARWDWVPWSWRMSRLRVQLEEARLATRRHHERAEFYRQHVVDHTTPSVRACRAADDAAEGFDHGSDGSDAPITADNQWRD